MSLPLDSGTWNLDPTHSQLGFSVRHLGITTLRGIFQESSGTVSVDGDQATIDVSAKMTSISTGNAYRDGHLQSGDFFDAENHPEMRFRSGAITLTSDTNGTIDGELTIRGISKPVMFNVTFNGTGTSPMDQSFRAGFTATGSITRSDFDVKFGIPMVSDTVDLALDIQLVKG
jgi:polyisoprenoid-binding protein YceI